MKKNVGKKDKITRLILGIVIANLGLFFDSLWGIIGLFIIIPAILGSDPLYNIININTNKSK